MRTKILKWLAITALVLAATWPSPMAYIPNYWGLVLAWVAFWTVQARRTGKRLQEAAFTAVSPKVKFEN